MRSLEERVRALLRRRSVIRVRMNLLWIGELMLVLLLGAAIEGALLPGSASTLSPLVPLDLAVMIGALGATVPIGELRLARTAILPTALLLVAQLVCLPAFAFLIALALPSPLIRQGLLVTALAPAEITSGAMVMIAAGDAIMAVRLMVASLILSVVTIPLGLQLLGGLAVTVQASAILPELLLIVLLPFLVGSIGRQLIPRLAAFQVEFNAICALAVIFLTFVVAAQIRALGMGGSLASALGGAILLNAFGYSLGWFLGGRFDLPEGQRRAAILSSGMREFGIATAVAIAFLPAGAAAVPAIYGLVMLVTAGAIASAMRRVRDKSEVKEPTHAPRLQTYDA